MPHFFYEQSLYVIVIISVTTTGFGAIPAFLSERFPTEIHNSSSGFAYNGAYFLVLYPLITLNLPYNAVERSLLCWDLILFLDR
jgi:hypothetical protein